MGRNLSKYNGFGCFDVVSVTTMSSHHYIKHGCKSTTWLDIYAHLHICTHTHTLSCVREQLFIHFKKIIRIQIKLCA